MSSTTELDQRYQLAIEIARAAGQLTLTHFRRDDLAVELKSDKSPVTAADRAAETLLREQIARQFPDDAILGEEFGEQTGTSGYRWILDPIDGTKSFIRGVPLYGTLIGVERDGESEIGVIYIPGSDECVHAVRGGSAYYQNGNQPPRVAQVSATPKLSAALFCTSDPVTFYQVGRSVQLHEFLKHVGLARTWGDCYGYLMVAVGRADLMVDPQMSVWDAAALQPIMEAAGGTFTDWDGVPTIHSGEGIATNMQILEEVLAITQGN